MLKGNRPARRPRDSSAEQYMTTNENRPISLPLVRKPSRVEPAFVPPGRAPESGPLVDSFGRVADDLRVSVTDRCNFRCTYCMPAEGLQWLARDDLLTYEEQARIVAVCVERFGFESVRITGGEPTVRAHLPRLVGMLAPLGVDLSMTTN